MKAPLWLFFIGLVDLPQPVQGDAMQVDPVPRACDADPEFAKAFSALTPRLPTRLGLHFAGAKRAATRLARIEKAGARIFAGRGRTSGEGAGPLKRVALKERQVSP